MDRNKINEYFLNLINDIIKNESEWSSEALLCKAGYMYEKSETLIDTELSVTSNFNVSIKYGASKLVIISNDNDEYSDKYVAKIPFDYADMDYCNEEFKTYNSLLEDYEDFKDYFAECWLAGVVDVKNVDGFLNHIPVYIMQRADSNENEVENSSYNFWINDGGKPDCYDPEGNEEVINCFKNYYGKELGEAIEEVIDMLEVTDLHSGNVGFIEGRPVLIDYSGYWG